MRALSAFLSGTAAAMKVAVIKERRPHERRVAASPDTVKRMIGMGLEVVAAGVEDQVTLDGLQALGCDSAQGFYLCAPIPADDLTFWMRRSVWGLAE